MIYSLALPLSVFIKLQPWPMNLAVKYFVVFWASRVFSVPQLMFYLHPLALWILQSGQPYLQVDLDQIGGMFQRTRLCLKIRNSQLKSTISKRQKIFFEVYSCIGLRKSVLSRPFCGYDLMNKQCVIQKMINLKCKSKMNNELY